ncbi:cytochrome oxidase subunit III [Marivirga tractuosa]|uniref:Cytochrome c oxidase subunit III n=1 Tax=Marivirga tractuosa (strain ATCC 23168 / DSM 4126 / NBRC 15989 / NCIMB 1408 / VKM B-1430 / H-43) TaxID=643867 RepID=E4TQH0_MARTH|nr:cytochrome c oxidase subunit 3 [Marivirga tractuosa]ADR23663.1 cytochrome c oxidase subunit III [Marivirga tractuosa DSM 4126]BDD15656.1 cytochrome oxidase subunit III [Marivirga tractuosa]
MDTSINKEQQQLQPSIKILSMHPLKFALWLFIVTVVMIFAALTSAYIVRQSEGNWLIFELPTVFLYNTIILVASSVSMHLAYLAAKKDNFKSLKLFMILTAVLAVAFFVGQYEAWGALVDRDVYFVGNPSGSFLYVISGLHAFHLISGLIFILIMLFSAFKYKVHSKNMVKMEMCTTYWHFLDGLWVYLFIFLLLNH